MVHNVLLTKHDETLKEGSRIHVGACIMYNGFIKDNEKTRQEARILANEFYLCDQKGDGKDDRIGIIYSS